MDVEIGDPYVRVEQHDLFKVVGSGQASSFTACARRGKPPAALRVHWPLLNPWRMSLRKMLLLAGTLAMSASAAAQPIPQLVQARIDRILKATPLIDGHNDLPEQLRENYKLSVEGLASGTGQRAPHPLMTDMARLHAGLVGAQFWSVYIPSDVTGDVAIRETLEQIDTVKRLV